MGGQSRKKNHLLTSEIVRLLRFVGLRKTFNLIFLRVALLIGYARIASNADWRNAPPNEKNQKDTRIIMRENRLLTGITVKIKMTSYTDEVLP